jgi:hypothetical protein
VKSDKEYTVDEMIHHMRNPANKLRSIVELDNVVEEIIDRNPKEYAELEQLIRENLNREPPNQ